MGRREGVERLLPDKENPAKGWAQWVGARRRGGVLLPDAKKPAKNGHMERGEGVEEPLPDA
jgi:hypothetical protein